MAGTSVGGEFGDLAERLASEFGAPIGLLDPSAPGRGWCARSGGEGEDRFPVVDAALIATLEAHGYGAARAAVWRPEGEGGPLWLAFPVSRAGQGALLGLAGFASSTDPVASAGWGPSCPVPALRSWGQEVSDRLRAEAEVPGTPPGLASAETERDEHLLLARLIRRLKVSDPPERFQNLASFALRDALGVAAVAWVPGHPQDAVVVSGSVAGLRNEDYRALVPKLHDIPSRVETLPIGSPEKTPWRVIAVAADGHGANGWLVALEPVEGRPLSASLVEILQPVASLVANQHGNARIYGELKGLFFGIIRALTAAIDAKDPYTSGHSERVARIAVRIAQQMGVGVNQRNDLYLMGLLHDIGKIGIDDRVLKKMGPLTPEERREIQSHVEIGVHILTDLERLRHLLPGVQYHHENLDGNGYPYGLAGDQIPLEARILAVADAFDAMMSTRPYRSRMSSAKVDEIFRSGAGSQWDPQVIEALFACRPDVERIRQKGIGESLQLVVNDTLGRR